MGMRMQPWLAGFGGTSLVIVVPPYHDCTVPSSNTTTGN